jgi:hypothetical protein
MKAVHLQAGLNDFTDHRKDKTFTSNLRLTKAQTPD